MPLQSQLPPSLKELMDMRSLYGSMGNTALFLPLPRPLHPPARASASPSVAGALAGLMGGGRDPGREGGPPSLLSFRGSTQPLSGEDATESQRQASARRDGASLLRA